MMSPGLKAPLCRRGLWEGGGGKGRGGEVGGGGRGLGEWEMLDFPRKCPRIILKVSAHHPQIIFRLYKMTLYLFS